MVPVCDKRYHIYNRFRHFWAEIKKLWNYPTSSFEQQYKNNIPNKQQPHTIKHTAVHATAVYFFLIYFNNRVIKVGKCSI